MPYIQQANRQVFDAAIHALVEEVDDVRWWTPRLNSSLIDF